VIPSSTSCSVRGPMTSRPSSPRTSQRSTA
jgi:hypothetical protein